MSRELDINTRVFGAPEDLLGCLGAHANDAEKHAFGSRCDGAVVYSVSRRAKLQSICCVWRQHNRHGLVRPCFHRRHRRPLISMQLVANAKAQGGNVHFTGPGPGNAQILASFFGLSANPANTPGGTNYAIGGALNDAALGPVFENLFTADRRTEPKSSRHHKPNRQLSGLGEWPGQS